MIKNNILLLKFNFYNLKKTQIKVAKKDTLSDSQPIIDYVKSVIPEVNVLSNVSAEVALQLPMEKIKEFG